MPRPPHALSGWVGQERKRRWGPQVPSPPETVSEKLLGSREGKAPGKLER